MTDAPENDGPQRLDAALAQGAARSRTHAARLIADGLVSVDGTTILKPSFKVRPGSRIDVAGADHYVSRAAHKLIAGLDAFGLSVDGRNALDVGASTGGFTQVLLERGARRVIALDVGHGQLDAAVAADDRVVVVEGFNARSMTPETLQAAAGETGSIDLVVGDLSFISLTMVIPALVETVGTAADFVLLIKPQFEVGRTGIREGIVRDAGLRNDAVCGVLWAAWDVGLGTAGIIPSPILGTTGNHEYVVHMSASGSNPTEWLERVSDLCA
ncbi:TlyA family RNA methyltransferase [Salinibacterium hongtaonis]|uniref:TlyA family rRNA (Cytidine-2'-O)-methyltransferase n=1 Tax=Homoserinimonas hongtaonis TaxID=2079791 RepID=A0A2U1SXS4_9MICO|nr:TlyA family RNA methyltransferase [Salinibacterium hongtaonis]PWB96409.1 TlyA family rRNA (cytidine-2'-O)-methyltransferase [Salinibacterium hongtaonis]